MQIKFFLEKFHKIVHEEVYSKKLVCEILYQVAGISVVPDNIKISKGVLYIHADSFVKNEIFLRKQKIIEYVSRSLQIRLTDVQ